MILLANMLDKEEIKKNFSRSAPDYDKHAWLQKSMADKLFFLVKELQPKRVLDVGCGTGYLTHRLAEHFFPAEVIGIDIAPGMIEVAKRRKHRGNLVFREEDGEKISFEQCFFDLIVSNASLQWMDAAKVFESVRKMLKTNGCFVFTTFGPQTLFELKTSGFRVNEFLSVNELLQLSKNFKVISIKSEIVKPQFASVKKLIYHLKELGAQSVDSHSRVDLQAFKNYKKNYSCKDQVFASFEIISAYLTV